MKSKCIVLLLIVYISCTREKSELVNEKSGDLLCVYHTLEGRRVGAEKFYILPDSFLVSEGNYNMDNNGDLIKRSIRFPYFLNDTCIQCGTLISRGYSELFLGFDWYTRWNNSGELVRSFKCIGTNPYRLIETLHDVSGVDYRKKLILISEDSTFIVEGVPIKYSGVWVEDTIR
jgi:hypothetical protein